MTAYPEMEDRLAHAPRRARVYRFVAAAQFPAARHDPQAPLIRMLDDGQGDVAACKIDPEPERWFQNPPLDLVYLQRMCRRCPIREACADYSLHNDVHGFWAGTTYRQRQLIRERMGIVAGELPRADAPPPLAPSASVVRESWA